MTGMLILGPTKHVRAVENVVLNYYQTGWLVFCKRYQRGVVDADPLLTANSTILIVSIIFQKTWEYTSKF